MDKMYWKIWIKLVSNQRFFENSNRNSTMSKQLINKVALVTGASRGIGKGIALQLGQNGAKVYITGRTLKSSDGSPSLEQTAEEVI